MILLDTNVVSEIMKASPEPRVLSWMDVTPAAALYIASVTKAELLYGIALLPGGKRRNDLAQAAMRVFDGYFSGRILAFDGNAAEAFAEIAAHRRRAGRPIGQSDAQIAAIAKSNGATLATRNVADFEQCGVDHVNPWEVAPA